MILIDKSNPQPIYRQLYDCIRRDILDGTLQAGCRLPSSRKLAEEHAVSRNTVIHAYSQLMAEGYIQAAPGSGHQVCNIDLGILPLNAIEGGGKERKLAKPPLANENPANQADIAAAFEYGPIDNAVYLKTPWRKSISAAMDRIDAEKTRFYPKRPGTATLQNALAGYLERARGIHCDPEQIVITCGIQHAMELLANLFSSGQRRFAVEDPGYDGTRKVFENRQFSILPIPVEQDGICVQTLRQLEADLLFLTPSHQFPTGAVLPVGKRVQLLDWASRCGCYIIEDDYVNELRYQTAPLPSLFSLDGEDCVIYAGTFAKSLAPDLRVAYLVLPRRLLSAHQTYYGRYNGQVSTLVQYALADFIVSGEYEKHISRLRTYYHKKQQRLCQAIQTVFGPKARIYGKGAGLHILLQVDSALPGGELVRLAREGGILLYNIEQHYVRKEQCLVSTVLLGLSYTPAEQYEHYIRRLSSLWGLE